MKPIFWKGDGGFPEVRFDNGECTFVGNVDACKQPIFYPREQLPWSHKIDIGVTCLTLHRLNAELAKIIVPAKCDSFQITNGWRSTTFS